MKTILRQFASPARHWLKECPHYPLRLLGWSRIDRLITLREPDYWNLTVRAIFPIVLTSMRICKPARNFSVGSYCGALPNYSSTPLSLYMVILLTPIRRTVPISKQLCHYAFYLTASAFPKSVERGFQCRRSRVWFPFESIQWLAKLILVTS